MKLKQEISLLQVQLSNFKRENEALRSGQGASLTVVKQNTDAALQNLHVVMNSAHASIKQLVSGAETLNLVAEILKSIDRITEVKDETDSWEALAATSSYHLCTEVTTRLPNVLLTMQLFKAFHGLTSVPGHLQYAASFHQLHITVYMQSFGESPTIW